MMLKTLTLQDDDVLGGKSDGLALNAGVLPPQVYVSERVSRRSLLSPGNDGYIR
jgi:hypothetical protein